MVELTCDACGKTQSFPATLEVVDGEVDGWALDVAVRDDHLVVNECTCVDCQSEHKERVERDIRETIEAARKYMSVEPTVDDIQRLCEFDVSREEVESVLEDT